MCVTKIVLMSNNCYINDRALINDVSKSYSLFNPNDLVSSKSCYIIGNGGSYPCTLRAILQHNNNDTHTYLALKKKKREKRI